MQIQIRSPSSPAPAPLAALLPVHRMLLPLCSPLPPPTRPPPAQPLHLPSSSLNKNMYSEYPRNRWVEFCEQYNPNSIIASNDYSETFGNTAMTTTRQYALVKTRIIHRGRSSSSRPGYFIVYSMIEKTVLTFSLYTNLLVTFLIII